MNEITHKSTGNTATPGSRQSTAGASGWHYDFKVIEKKWQQKWQESGSYKVFNDSLKPKYYVLDMFPYPSGTGLHVGHPLGYIASDIYARYKRLKGFNVLHTMGYDSFGLPAEQYALETGQHPAVTTAKNIKTFRSQLDNIGFSFDWSREVSTSDPEYYKWTQWIFLQIFNSWYDYGQNKARRIEELIKIFKLEGSRQINMQRSTPDDFSAADWHDYTEEKKQEVLMHYRLAYSAFGEVNWCEALGTVLANDEVINGVSERGSHPVVKKKMRQWYLRITAYAERLLQGLEKVNFSDAMKEMQKNWIGKSEGAEIKFKILDVNSEIEVYTTRPDTIFGVDFMVLAPEHELVDKITTPEQKEVIDNYLQYVKSRSERERLSEVKSITGAFTGAFAINPFDGKKIPVWIAEYVLAGYGTGAIMAVPCGDQRDYNFARHFNISITNIIGEHYQGSEANATKEATLTNSGFLNGMVMKNAIPVVLQNIEEKGIGKRKVNYKMRDAGFSRQRYWGEPFPIIYRNGIAYALEEGDLPVELPHVEKYSPGPEGEGPLANIREWVQLAGKGTRETNTMPGYAGSSWYFLRYMDPQNKETFAGRKATDYWNQVDVYVGGTEHAVGHLLYSRLWTKILFDLNYLSFEEPYRKLVNQGMIQGSSRFVYRLELADISNSQQGSLIISRSHYENLENLQFSLAKALEYLNEYLPSYFATKFINEEDKLNIAKIHVDVNFVDGFDLDIDQFKKWRNAEYGNATFLLEDGKVLSPNEDVSGLSSSKYICGAEVEKMSKSKYNTIDPNELINKYGADTFRMYEMFLGPVEQSKPWDTKGIEGVHRFLKKLWRLFYDDITGIVWHEAKASDTELKVLHKTIKKIEEDTERFSYNTAVSAFMVCVNELTELKCHKKEVLAQLLVLLTPYAPHISEELWASLANTGSILDAAYPIFDPDYLIESEIEYPVSINGKMRTTIKVASGIEQAEIEKIVLQNEIIQKWLEGKSPKKIIFVKNRMVNVVA